MRKRLLNLIEAILSLIIILVCITAILQSNFLRNNKLFGFYSYFVENAIEDKFNEGDVILLSSNTEKIKNGDIVVYEIDDQLFVNEVIEISDSDEIIVSNEKDDYSYIPKEKIESKFSYRFVFISLISQIIKHKVGLILSLVLPFLGLLSLELIAIFKESKRKEIEKEVKETLDEFKSFEDKSELSKAIEQSIEMQIKEIKDAKRDFKKIDSLEQTIQIPMEEIQKQIRELSKNTKEESDDCNNDTLVLFTKDDIKDVIKKELKNTKNKSKK